MSVSAARIDGAQMTVNGEASDPAFFKRDNDHCRKAFGTTLLEVAAVPGLLPRGDTY